MPIDSTSFNGSVTPPELVAFVANAVRTGAPFAKALKLLTASHGSVNFPVAAPEAFDWTAEGAPLPVVDLGDDSLAVAIAKLAGTFAVGNETVDDAELPIADLLGQAVAQAMGPSLDDGLLHGAAPPEPAGVLANAPLGPAGDDFREAVILSWGALIDAGSPPDNIVAFATGAAVAAELARTGTTEQPIHPDGAEAMVGPGIRLIAVPSLAEGEVLVADTASTYLVMRKDFAVELSDQPLFTSDQTAVRVKGRFAVAAPTPDKSLRLAQFAS
jgi:hypothetical protein